MNMIERIAHGVAPRWVNTALYPVLKPIDITLGLVVKFCQLVARNTTVVR